MKGGKGAGEKRGDGWERGKRSGEKVWDLAFLEWLCFFAALDSRFDFKVLKLLNYRHWFVITHRHGNLHEPLLFLPGC